MRSEKEIQERRNELLEFYQEHYFKSPGMGGMLSLERAVMILNWVLGGDESLTDEQEKGRRT